MRRSLRFSSSLLVDGLIWIAYLATQAPAFNQVGFDGFEGNVSFLASPFRDQAVVEILPEPSCLRRSIYTATFLPLSSVKN